MRFLSAMGDTQSLVYCALSELEWCRVSFLEDLQGFQNLVGLESHNTFTLSVIANLIRDLIEKGEIRVSAKK